MRFKQNGNKKDIMAVVVYNNEASASIPVGAPVCLSFNGTQDGLGVVLPATAADVGQSTGAFGAAMGVIPAGQFGEAQVFGAGNVKVMRTRAASSDTFAALANYSPLKAESTNNSFMTVATNGASAFIPVAFVAGSIAAVATTAASTQTMTTQLVQAFLRMM